MFDVKNVPATPAWARRLAHMAQFTTLDLSKDLLELSQQDVINVDALARAGITLDAKGLAATQYAVDWNCRCAILDTNDVDAHKVALAALVIRPQRSVVILTHPRHYARWARAIRALWADASIAVYGNSRYSGVEDGVGYPEGVSYGHSAQPDAQWQITSYGSFIHHDVMSRRIPDQIVVDEISDKSNINYRWADSLYGLFLETPRVMVLQNVNTFSADSTDSFTSLITPGSDGYNHLMWILNRAILPGSVVADWMQGPEQGTVLQHLHNTGFPGVDLLQVMSMMGVSTHLLNVDPFQSLRFHDHTVSKAVASGHANSSLRKYVEHQRTVAQRAGGSLDAMVATMMDGGTAQFVEELKNNTWATLKSSLVAQVYTQLSSRRVNIAVLAHTDALVRNIRMRLGIELYGDNPNTALTTARYLHPRENWRSYWSGEIPPPINGLVYRDALDLSVDVMQATDYLIIAEWPHDAELLALLQELARASDVRIVYTTLTGTFERSLEDILLPQTP